MRKEDPNQNMSMEGDFMKLAMEHAERRMSKKPDSAFEIAVSCWLELHSAWYVRWAWESVSPDCIAC